MMTSSAGTIAHRIQPYKKDYGIFFTPEWLVDLMVELIGPATDENLAILEPACGLTQFLSGIARRRADLYATATCVGVDINADVFQHAITRDARVQLVHADYLLWDTAQTFDLIIGNPPYGIPSLSSHYTIKVDAVTKRKYRNLYDTWYGKYNVYGAFIEKSVKLLRTRGQLLFIVPATFMILDEFTKLRQFLAQHGQTRLIYMGAEVFVPDASVATVILDFRKEPPTARLEMAEYRDKQFHPVLKRDNWRGEVITFETAYTRQLTRHCSAQLRAAYDVRISPRTPEIKNHAQVRREPPDDMTAYLPILTGRNLKRDHIVYDNLSGYWIPKSAAARLRGYSPTPHVVVGLGFRGNGGVGAAVDDRGYPWMGDVYHLTRLNTPFTTNDDLDNEELAAWLNSDYVARYIRETYREITYHLSKTQIMNLPLPTRAERDVIWRELEV